MKRLLMIALAAITLALTAGCADEMSYENALDRDREAREKVDTALTLMEEAAAIEEKEGELSESELAAIESKREEALNAYQFALESWEKAEAIYDHLIESYPDDPVYLNNLANLLYNKVEKGVGTEEELDRAKELMEKALEAHEREMFRTNYDLIVSIREDEETKGRVEKNRATVEDIMKLEPFSK